MVRGKTKSGFQHVQVGPWPAGMVNVIRDTSLPPTAVTDAVNVKIRPDGTVTSRHNWRNVLVADGRDLYRHGTRTFAVLDDIVCELNPSEAVPLFGPVGRINWTNLNNQPVFCTREAVFNISEIDVEQFTYQRDEQDVDDVLVDLPGGQWVDYWNGRLVVARGATLLFSEPLRYGAHNPHTGYVRMPSRIEWLAPLESGIYVGLMDKVLFLRGASVDEFEVKTVSAASAPGMALIVPGEFVGTEGNNASQVAVFFTRRGFTLGLPDGTVSYPQGSMLENLPLFPGKLVREKHRIFAIRGY